MKRILSFGFIILVLGALAFPKIKPLLNSPSEENNNGNRFAGSDLLQVQAVEVSPESIDNKIFSSGTIQANEIVELSAEVSGKITGIYFEEGRPVERDQLLMKINDSELQAQKRRAEFRLNLAEQREERQRRLLERGGISQEDYDATQNEVNVLRSEIDLIDAQVEKTEIRAPFSGYIGLKYVSEGSYISPQTRLASLNDINPVKVEFSIPERYVTQVDVGDKINFNVQGHDSTFVGEVYAVEPRIDAQTRTLRLRAMSDNSERMLVPGAFANIELILETEDQALMVPSISVIPELNRQKVYVFRDGRVYNQVVQTGIRTSNAVQVVNGLAPGDTVLTTGLLQVREGMQVNVTEIQRQIEL